jgi:diaminopimelate decarboxylase
MMDGFEYRDGELFADEVPVRAITDKVGTPTYVYSASGIRAAYGRLKHAFGPLGVRTLYAVKASSNLHLLRLLHGLGAGMDVVSGGELERAWLAGVPMADIVFAGVGKSDAELRAALDGRFSPLAQSWERIGGRDPAGRGPVGMFNVESVSELSRIADLAAQLGVVARICLRVNPDVDPRTHEYITTGKEENKFGIEADQILSIFGDFAGRPGLELAGLHVHIGSAVRDPQPYVDAVKVVLNLAAGLEAAGHPITDLDIGGGWAISYQEGEAPPIEAYTRALAPLLAEPVSRGLRVVTEPGRALVGHAGLLLTRVQHVKKGRRQRFLICDAGMQTLIRPALYKAFHFIWPALVAPEQVPPGRLERPDLPGLEDCSVVGPICESSDFLAKHRLLPAVERGDLLAVFSAGAYGMSMSSNYNDHGRPAEVLVDGHRAWVINERQTLAALLATERERRELAIPLRETVPL